MKWSEETRDENGILPQGDGCVLAWVTALVGAACILWLALQPPSPGTQLLGLALLAIGFAAWCEKERKR